jgi:hypothetical protein
MNLESMFLATESTVLMGHIRAVRCLSLLFRHSLFSYIKPLLSQTFDSPVAIPNCHPFQFGRWLFMHNGKQLLS